MPMVQVNHYNRKWLLIRFLNIMAFYLFFNREGEDTIPAGADGNLYEKAKSMISSYLSKGGDAKSEYSCI